MFLFFLIEHRSRRVVHVGVTRNPTDAWLAQQVRDATPFGVGPRFLICDNDAKYGLQFTHAAEGAGIEIIHTPYFTPKANAICERFIGSVRRECLDFILILQPELQKEGRLRILDSQWRRRADGTDKRDELANGICKLYGTVWAVLQAV